MEFHFHEQHTIGDTTHHHVDGEHVATTFKHVFGGYEYIDAYGKTTVIAHENVHGGHDIFVDGKLEGSTVQNADGGHTVMDGSYLPVAETTPDGAGGLTVIEQGHFAGTFISVEESGFQTVMQMTDPLKHIHLYHMPGLVWG